MHIPNYFKQEKSYTCSLAVLRMVLQTNGSVMTETELEDELFLLSHTKIKNIPNLQIFELAKRHQLKVEILDSVDMEKLVHLLSGKNTLIQLSIKLDKMYPKKHGFHSILLYSTRDGFVQYHDPSYGASLECSIEKLKRASKGAGKIIVYSMSRLWSPFLQVF